MSLFILDTDHLTLLRQAHPAVVTRAVFVSRDELATTVITFEEQVSGWYTAVRKARDADKLARAYAGLHEIAQTARVIRFCGRPETANEIGNSIAILPYCQMGQLYSGGPATLLRDR